MPALPKATWVTLRLGVWESNCAIALEPPVAPAGSTSRLLSGPKYYDMSQPPCRLESGLTRNDTFEIWTRYEASIGGGVDGWA
ncbi:MAG: hypothetical protein HY822_09120 [Acidobacteria bacterium]|nr:hypothetical protein [Acidobacteriota bacterium]